MSNFGEKSHSNMGQEAALPGSMNDDDVVRSIVTSAIKASKKSRAEIAEQMSYLVGDRITERALSSWTSESMEKHRFPIHFARAFCSVTNNWRLAQCVAELAGFTVIDKEDLQVLELGRSYLQRKEAEENMKALERALDRSISRRGER